VKIEKLERFFPWGGGGRDLLQLYPHSKNFFKNTPRTPVADPEFHVRGGHKNHIFRKIFHQNSVKTLHLSKKFTSKLTRGSTKENF